MSTENVSTAPSWAHRNTKRLLDDLDSQKLFELLYIPYRPGLILDKRKLSNDIAAHVKFFQTNGTLIITGKTSFVIATKSFSLELNGDREQCVSIIDVSYRIMRTRIAVTERTIMNISYHCLLRIFERDIINSMSLIPAILNCGFIEELNNFLVNDVSFVEGDPVPALPFAFKFGDGFITGTVRLMRDYRSQEMMIVYDARTFLLGWQKPDWQNISTDKIIFKVDKEDRRTLVMRNVFKELYESKTSSSDPDID